MNLESDLKKLAVKGAIRAKVYRSTTYSLFKLRQRMFLLMLE